MDDAVASDVFLNCPSDREYEPTFRALVFAIYWFDFRPRCALELDDASQTRIDKIYGLVEQCRFGVHDLSRTELDAINSLPRFNMPLELGLFLGAKRFGDIEQRRKRCLVLDVEPFRYQKFISDLAGVDIRAHNGEPEQAVHRLRDWLANVSRRKLAGGDRVRSAYRTFCEQLPALAEAAELHPDKLTYVDLEVLIAVWLEEGRKLA